MGASQQAWGWGWVTREPHDFLCPDPSVQELMGRYITRGYGVGGERSQMEKIEVSEGKANGTTRETLKGHKSGRLAGIYPGILQRTVNSQDPAHLGLGPSPEGVPRGCPGQGVASP